jgi:hypothetical protein
MFYIRAQIERVCPLGADSNIKNIITFTLIFMINEKLSHICRDFILRMHSWAGD